MIGAAMTHEFEESLKYIYPARGVFANYKSFFDHDVHAFVRYDPTQMQFVKSCQVCHFVFSCRTGPTSESPLCQIEVSPRDD